MAADAGLIRSVSQAYKNNIIDFKMDESLADFGSKVAAGITKRQELKLAKEKEEAIKQEKLDIRMRAADRQAMQNELVISGKATTQDQLNLVKDFYGSKRERAKELTRIIATSSPSSSEYQEATNELTSMATEMQFFANQMDSLNELEGGVSAIDLSSLATHNTDEVKDFTARVKEGDYNLVFKDNKILLDFGDGKVLNQDEVLENLAVLPDTSIMNVYSGIAANLKQLAINGVKLEGQVLNDLNADLFNLRKQLEKTGPTSLNQIKTMLSEQILEGYDPKDDEVQQQILLALQQAKTPEEIVEAKTAAINYLVGDGVNDKQGQLGRAATLYHKGYYIKPAGDDPLRSREFEFNQDNLKQAVKVIIKNSKNKEGKVNPTSLVNNINNSFAGRNINFELSDNKKTIVIKQGKFDTATQETAQMPIGSINLETSKNLEFDLSNALLNLNIGAVGINEKNVQNIEIDFSDTGDTGGNDEKEVDEFEGRFENGKFYIKKIEEPDINFVSEDSIKQGTPMYDYLQILKADTLG